MTMEDLIGSLPFYAREMKLNYSSLVRQNTELTSQQLWGTVVAVAMAMRSSELTVASIAEAKATGLSSQALEAVRTAVTIMGMTNIYYRFQHLTTNGKYAAIPSRLRMNTLRERGVDSVDYELWCLVVSVINACDQCVDAHEQALRKKGVTEASIHAAIRVTAVIHAIGVVLDAEKAAPTLASGVVEDRNG